MNKISFFGLALTASAAAISTASCSDYLEVELKDQMTLQEVFAKRATTLNYLGHIYSYLPEEAEYQGSNSIEYGGDAAVGTAMSDEALFSWYQWVTYLNFRTGDWGTSTFGYNNWTNKYTGIEQAGIFLENVDQCPEFTAKEKEIMKAEARVLRAYDYFQLFRRFGPVVVWGDRRSDRTIRPEDIDRNTVDENIDFMVSEIDKAIPVLPEDIVETVQFEGRVTKGAAMALKSRILLYAASPQFNGCDLYKGKMMNREGKYLFPQEYDGEKWEKAAKAAKDIIDMNKYRLLVNTEEEDPMLRAIKSYQDIHFKAWNEEIIWGFWPRYVAATYNIPSFNRQRMLPPNAVKDCNGGYCASMKLFDSYPMQETGRYPIDPVVEARDGYDGLNPNIDPKSGYSITGFENGWEHPIEGPEFGAVKAHKSCVGRDARFYASIMANGFLHVNEHTKTEQNFPITFFTGGTSGFNPNDCVKSGFLWRRFLDPSINYSNTNSNYGEYFFWYFRLAEIYLNYAEACNEKPNREPAEALKYVNLIRERAGLNKLEEAYPEYDFKNNQEALRQMIRKERMVELAFEGHRYYDVRRWMTATKELTNKNWTLDLIATNYEASWERTTRVWAGRDNLFEEKHYLFPIFQAQLSEMKNITQNYGW